MQRTKQRQMHQSVDLARYFKSPVESNIDELVQLRELAANLVRSSKRRVQSGQAGPAATKVLGRGLDFAEVRGYQPGDDVRLIDWKVTARSGHAHTKLFVEERERPFFLMVDVRATMRFATRNMFKSVMATRLAALLGWCAVAHNDRVGGLVFSDQGHIEVKPQSGRRGLMSLFRALITAQSEANDSAIDAGLQQNLARLRYVAPTGCSICLLSDFSGFDDAAQSAIGPLLHRCDVLAVMINDPLELSLPRAGVYAVRDASQRFVINTRSTSEKNRYAQKQREKINDVRDFFSRRRSGFRWTGTEESIAAVASELISQVAVGVR